MAIMASSSRAAGRRFGRSRSAVVALAAAAGGLALLASGCGGGSPGAGVAQIGSANSGTSGSKASSGSRSGDVAAYSACMRKHGVTNFPDPDSNGGLKITSGMVNGHRVGIDVDSAQFKKAQQACQKLLPSGGRPDPQQQAREAKTSLAFAKCMRSHGVPKFPDPQVAANGGVLWTMRKGTGVNPNSPQFQAAQRACQKLVPGSPFSAGPGKAP